MLFRSLLRGFGQTKVQAESASLTISGAVTGMTNSWVGFVGAMDQAVGASKMMVSGINALARGLENLSSIAKDARSNITTLLSIAANPGGFVGSLLTSITPAEKLAADIEKQRKIINIEFNNSQTFERMSDSVLFMCNLVGLKETRVNELWEYGMRL